MSKRTRKNEKRIHIFVNVESGEALEGEGGASGSGPIRGVTPIPIGGVVPCGSGVVVAGVVVPMPGGSVPPAVLKFNDSKNQLNNIERGSS